MARGKVATVGSNRARAAARRTLGTLEELSILPSNFKRYNAALVTFFEYLNQQGGLPSSVGGLEEAVALHLADLWLDGSKSELPCSTCCDTCQCLQSPLIVSLLQTLAVCSGQSLPLIDPPQRHIFVRGEIY